MAQNDYPNALHIGPTYIGAQPPSGSYPMGGGFNVNHHGSDDHHAGDSSFAYIDAFEARGENIRNNYAITMANLSNLISQELQILRSKVAVGTTSPSELLSIEVNIRGELVGIKTNELAGVTQTANAFYGVSPIGKSTDEWWGIYNSNSSTVDPDKLLQDWTASYYAAHVASILTNQINAINADSLPYKDSLIVLSDVNKEILQKFGASAAQVAQSMQDNIAGKNIRSYAEALAVFEKVSNNPSIKLNAQDTQAVVSAIKALDAATMADNMTRLGKGFGVVGYTFQASTLIEKTSSGFETGDWKPLLLELEAIGVGAGAGAIGAAIFSFFAFGFVGPATSIVVVALILASAAAYFDAAKVDEINQWFIK